ncbi:hypothetical protein HNV11_12595 [Spirosoma taeanense]|uniref:Lipocalin-like domain-containing protein n=1 Tax=Spirosoma taeanense TaxID=2735870 RepID=A0A6M5Y881_9BACT|nr:hypothetical protein [Spirosoma taeanense]QJW90155.1 hypothetical protein HNV11_12595 [Spirosoma taeanense]
MKRSRFLFFALLVVASLAGCKDDSPNASTQTELLVANNWLTRRVTTPDGQEINRSRLNLATQVLFDLNMQFRSNGTVRALDPRQANSVVNGGTWKLAADNQSIDVDVSGFKGNFPIIQLNRTKLILRQRAPVDGKDTDVNLEFEPVV